MRFFATPLTALFSSFFTWYALQQQDGGLVQEVSRPALEFEADEGLPENRGEAAVEDSDSTAAQAVATLEKLRAELRTKERRIKQLESQTSRPTEPGPAFHDLLDAGTRTAGIFQDMGSHALSTAATKLWPWPSPKVELPDLAPHLQFVRQKTSEHLEPAVGAVQELRNKVPREVSEPLLGAVEVAKGALQTAHSRTSLVAQAAVDNFLEAHPHHRASFSGVPPVFFFALIPAVFWELWRLLKFVYNAACCFRCCRRNAQKKPKAT